MGTRFRPYQPKQLLMLPPDLGEWVPEGHLAHQVSELVDGLELGAFYRRYEEDGRRNSPYEPRMMVKVLIYAYATGVFSSRKIAKKLEEDVAFRMLAAGNFPQHRTLSEFRRRHLKDFKKLFVSSVSLFLVPLDTVQTSIAKAINTPIIDQNSFFIESSFPTAYGHHEIPIVAQRPCFPPISLYSGSNHLIVSLLGIVG